MISQFFILNARGDTIIYKDFRSDLSKNVPEKFNREVKLSAEAKSPIFEKDGIIYAYMNRASLHLVCTSRFNKSPSFMMEILMQISKVITDLCGVLNEDAIRKNFMMIYEILDEMVDFGVPQLMKTKDVRNFVKSQAVEVVKPKSKKLAPWSNKNTKDSSSTNLAVTRTTNELFIDILEHISATFNASGNIINSSINGTIISKSYIMGTPAFKMKFCDKVNIDEDSTYGIKIDNASFNSCVNFSDFELNKTLIMKPPRGTCEIMQYRITKDFNYPFKFHSFINEKSNFKLEFTVKLNPTYTKNVTAKYVNLEFNIPKTAATVNLHLDEISKNKSGEKAEYIQADNKVIWSMKKVGGLRQKQITAIIVLREEMNSYQIRKELGPIKCSFEVNNYTSSGVFIDYLRADSGFDPKKPPLRWIRYLTRSNSYISRV